MTLDEAVKQLTINRPSTYTELREAIDMAIEALKPKPMQKFDNVKQHIDRLAGDYKCWDERLSHEEALELSRMLEQQPCEDIKEYYKDVWDCDINHPRYEDTVAEIVKKSYMSGYVQGIENTAKEFRVELEQEPCTDLCKSCDTKGCIFQFGIKRKKCDFYTQKKRGMSDEQIRTVIGALTCEDAISRAYIEPFVEELENICINGDEHVLDILSNIKNSPSVTPKQKVGHWIAVENEEMETVGYYCSECDLPMETEQRTFFCPNCGAKMKESKEP